ncbi:MAG: outer membrane lipoprotein chaperone LolA [Gammaproteobacteria bacterium]|nr:outer membrane lipoprotein chaperone LolA [Gammaproteobacteria bacterium]
MSQQWGAPISLVSMVLLWATIFGLSGIAVAQSSDPLAQFLQDTQSLQAVFGQDVSDENGELIESSSGQFWLARPGRFRWQYSVPYHQLLVADGEQLWIYDEELAQVTVQPQSQVMSEAVGLLLAGESEVMDQFRVELMSDKTAETRYALRPRSEESGLERIELVFVGGLVQQMELWDKLGQITRLRFAEVELKASLAPELFRFIPPEGVDVIGVGGD